MIAACKRYLRSAQRAVGRARHGEPISRSTLARQYLVGEGIEIGALCNPLEVPSGVRVRYVDRMPVAELRKQYPELAALPLVPLDVIDDGERLGTVADASQDFVIANHFLEHCEDPTGTISSMVRVLRPGGVLYMAVPDKRYTFDCERPVTTVEHLVRDHEAGPAGSRDGHYDEFVRLVLGKDGETATAATRRLLDMNYSIHFHVWDAAAFLEFLNMGQRRVGYEVEVCVRNGYETIAVLRKPGGPEEANRTRSAQRQLADSRRS